MESSRVTIRAIYDIEPWREVLTAALRHDIYGLTFEDLSSGVTAKQYIALEIDGAACAVLELVEGLAGAKVLHTIAIGGRYMPRWIPAYIRCVSALAKEQGAGHITCMGRRGWVRVLQKYGFKARATALAMEVR